MKRKEWINAKIIKPKRAEGFTTLSKKVRVKTLFGEGTGYYNFIDDDWLVELNDDITDELQAYKGVTHWQYMNNIIANWDEQRKKDKAELDKQLGITKQITDER